MTFNHKGYLVLLALWAMSLGSWAAAACDETAYPQSLELEGFGTIYLGDLRFEAAADRAELFNGICFVSEGDPAWSLTAPRMQVENLQGRPRFTASAATLDLGNFTIFAERLTGADDGLSLEGVAFSSPQLSGSAERAAYRLPLGRTELQGVRLQLGSFRVESAGATLTEGALVLSDAQATTCACEGGGLYTLRAPRVRIDFGSGLVRVQNGVLETLGLRVALEPNLQLVLDGPPQPGARAARGLNLGGATLLPTPAAPEPVGETIDEGSKVSLPIQLQPGAALELGVAGLDDGHPFGVVSLLQLGQGNVRAALGRVGPGVRADLLVRRPFAPGIGLDFSLTNRDWQEAGFLHEGSLGLYAGRRLSGVVAELADTLVVGGQLFSAFSSQRLPSGPVLSPRLGVRGSATYTLPPSEAGTFGLRTEGSLTHYPGRDADAALTQVGVRFVPSWRASFGPFRTNVSFDRVFTNGASPFSLNFDRLAPRSLLDASAELELPVARVGVQGRYNALFAAQGRAPMRRLRFTAHRDLAWAGGSAEARLEAELAGLLGPTDPNLDAFVGAQSSFSFDGDTDGDTDGGAEGDAGGSGLELGLQGRYNLLPAQPGFDLLEVSASYPLTLSDVTLRPFLALNAAPLLSDRRERSVLSGYGLELAVKSCCGTLIAAYRLHDGAVSTAFDVQLVPDPEVFKP